MFITILKEKEYSCNANIWKKEAAVLKKCKIFQCIKRFYHGKTGRLLVS